MIQLAFEDLNDLNLLISYIPWPNLLRILRPDRLPHFAAFDIYMSIQNMRSSVAEMPGTNFC
jgi:hypothetical protein